MIGPGFSAAVGKLDIGKLLIVVVLAAGTGAAIGFIWSL